MPLSSSSKQHQLPIAELLDGVFPAHSAPSLPAPPAAPKGRPQLPLVPRPRHVLYGHQDEVTCLALSHELDLVVSGAADGTVLVHTLLQGRCGGGGSQLLLLGVVWCDVWVVVVVVWEGVKGYSKAAHAV